jgi:hypothetical protein
MTDSTTAVRETTEVPYHRKVHNMNSMMDNTTQPISQPTVTLGGRDYRVVNNRCEMQRDAFDQLDVSTVPIGCVIVLERDIFGGYTVEIERTDDNVVDVTFVGVWYKKYWDGVIGLGFWVRGLTFALSKRMFEAHDVDLTGYNHDVDAWYRLQFTMTTVAGNGHKILDYCERLLEEMVEPLNRLATKTYEELNRLGQK